MTRKTTRLGPGSWQLQVEVIGRALTHRQGRTWIRRPRTQAERDEPVRAAGFAEVSQEIDPWGHDHRGPGPSGG